MPLLRRWSALTIFLLVPLALAAGGGEAHAQAQRMPVFPYERIPVAFRSVHSGMCLDIRAAGGDGAALQQYPCHDLENQSFFLNWAGDADYQLRPGHMGNVRLGIAGDSTADGAGAQLINGDYASEIFQFVPEANGTYSIVNKHSGKCLDVPGWSTTAGQQIEQWWCSAGTNQRWEVIPRARPFHLRGKYSTYCAGFLTPTVPGVTYTYQDCLGTDADHQEWIAVPTTVNGTQYWKLRNAATSRCLTATTTTPYYYELVQGKCGTVAPGLWSITGDPDGNVELTNVATGHCLGTYNGSSAVGSELYAAPCDGSDSQRFAFQRYIRRHVVVVEPATSAGTNRYTANPIDIQVAVDQTNLVYRKWGIELLYDASTDHVQYDSDALHNLQDVNTWNTTYACDDPLVFLTPGDCAQAVGAAYPDRVVLMIGPGAVAGFSSGQSSYIFLRPGPAPNQCGTSTWGYILAHELGHYFGLSHVFAAGHADGYAAGAAYTAAGNSTAVFDGDRLADTWPDPVIGNSNCIAPTQPWTWTWLQGFWGTWPFIITSIAIPVSTENVMSYYFNVSPAITPQQAGIVGATAYMRGL
jgi:hypothetical protein